MESQRIIHSADKCESPEAWPSIDILDGTWATILQRGQMALFQLLQAHEYAGELARSDWDFAVEISVLRDLGLTNGDLRWMMCKGFVAQGRELLPDGQDQRMVVKSDSLTFRRTTCFVLQQSGVDLLRRTLQQGEIERNEAVQDSPVELLHDLVEQPVSATNTVENDKITELPEWNGDLQELRVGNQIVKRFKVPAPNQELILMVFQEEGWPVHIHDPLPQNSDQDPKRRLHDTINSLNRCHKNPLIRFTGDGKGTGVRWEFSRRDD